MPRVESHLLAFETRNTLKSEGKKRSITTGGRGAGTHPPGPGKRRGCDSRLWWTGATRDDATLPWGRGGDDGLRRAQPDPVAHPSWRQEALGLSPMSPPPRQSQQQLTLGPGNPMGPSMPGSPCGGTEGGGCNPSLGDSGLWTGRGGEGTYLSPLLSRLSRLAHVALGALKADDRGRNKGGIGPGELLGGGKTVVLGLGGQVTITAPPRDP